MELFKDRLLKTAKDILFFIVWIIAFYFCIWLMATFFVWVFAVLIVLLLLFGTGYFINLLFIEPFRKKKGEGKV